MPTKPVKKLHIKTHGCQMNEYDSSRIQDLLGESHQMVATDSAEEADVLLVNTCSIREKAQEKLFHQLGRWKQLKAKNPDLIIGVGGYNIATGTSGTCVTQIGNNCLSQ